MMFNTRGDTPCCDIAGFQPFKPLLPTLIDIKSPFVEVFGGITVDD